MGQIELFASSIASEVIDAVENLIENGDFVLTIVLEAIL